MVVNRRMSIWVVDENGVPVMVWKLLSGGAYGSSRVVFGMRRKRFSGGFTVGLDVAVGVWILGEEEQCRENEKKKRGGKC